MVRWPHDLFFAVQKALLNPIRAFVDKRIIESAHRSEILGVSVYYTDREVKYGELSSIFLDKVTVALSLISHLDPRRLRHLQVKGLRVLIQSASTSGYLAASNTILLATRDVEKCEPAVMAGILVHEATHARIERLGIRRRPSIRSRIERRCLLEQISFLERVPGRRDLVEYYRSWLSRTWWDPKHRLERRLRYFREIGAPRWFLRIYEALAKPRSL